MDDPQQDLTACEREPIHIPGAIQPHGALAALHPDGLTLVAASANLPAFIGGQTVLGQRPDGVLGEVLGQIEAWHGSDQPFLRVIARDGRHVLTARRSDGLVVVEVEEARAETDSAFAIFAQLNNFVQEIAGQRTMQDALEACARVVRALSGFDRVLVYRFDADWNGRVMAESGNERLPSYLDLRFPAADIPAQARRLYAESRLRVIPDADYRPVPIEPSLNPLTDQPLDLSFAQLRSVSPVHLEYMRNMGTRASMSVSIMVNGALWGLVSCHSAEATHLSPMLRDACDFVVQSLAMRIGAQERAEDAAARERLSVLGTRLLAAMTGASDWVAGIMSDPDALLEQVGATGAAMIAEDRLEVAGDVPDKAAIRAIIAWLETRGVTEVYATDRLPHELPQLDGISRNASGLLVLRISDVASNWLLWFRPEVVETVTWAGNPHKMVREEGRIHPRHSFEAWREQVRGHAIAWSDAERAAAQSLRTAIVGVVLRRAEELAQLSRELQRSNKELEAFSYSVSHDLRAPFRHIVGFAQLLRERESGLESKSQHYLQMISDSALAAGRLVDDLLNFSQLGRASLSKSAVDMNKLVDEVLRSIALSIEGRAIEWRISRLPPTFGDATLIRQVWFNLIDNAVKYTRPCEKAVIVIDGQEDDGVTRYRVQDNGVGFDMTYAAKLFGVFQRLQRAEDFEGTGIGLALVRRILDRHNGSIAAEGEVGKGASFTFALPLPEKKGRALV
ncbi:histidine kinase [Xaviernesmea oryzae]|uniref:histidine kinase n=1 Tax=Xaviernesmea oryzae TaxID=464029 RepID=A0A1Q9B2H8_9HYPH|nr:ATP-binding protein [Xaviernesmea oryzae]OLP62208.1 histidine kinase [Xaviernesmea oryzae]SEL91851.1 phytochrome sensor signal transduction histidine kinase [Xaviernesmea oryzae]